MLNQNEMAFEAFAELIKLENASLEECQAKLDHAMKTNTSPSLVTNTQFRVIPNHPNLLTSIAMFDQKYPGRIYTLQVAEEPQTFSNVVSGSGYFEDINGEEEWIPYQEVEDIQEEERNKPLYKVVEGMKTTGQTIGYLIAQVPVDSIDQDVFVYEHDHHLLVFY